MCVLVYGTLWKASGRLRRRLAQVLLHSPNLLWSCRVPCTVPLGKISSWKPVRQYSCLLRRMPFRWPKSVSDPRCSLPSIRPSLSFSPSDNGTFPNAGKACKSRSMLPRNPATSAMTRSARDHRLERRETRISSAISLIYIDIHIHPEPRLDDSFTFCMSPQTFSSDVCCRSVIRAPCVKEP